MSDLIVQNSGHAFSRISAESVDGGVDSSRVILLKSDGSQEVLFVGEDFSEEGWDRKMKVQNRTSYIKKLSL